MGDGWLGKQGLPKVMHGVGGSARESIWGTLVLLSRLLLVLLITKDQIASCAGQAI